MRSGRYAGSWFFLVNGAQIESLDAVLDQRGPGRARFLVQVDDSYHTATSLRICHQPEGHMDILLIQTASIGQCLRGLWQHRRGKPAPVWRGWRCWWHTLWCWA